MLHFLKQSTRVVLVVVLFATISCKEDAQEKTPKPLHKEGESFEGGVIFHLDDNTGQHGLIAAINDQSTGDNWYTAKTICENLDLNSYSDWYLPSDGELVTLRARGMITVGNFDLGYYWTSTEVDGANAYGILFEDGQPYPMQKIGTMRVRAIRSF